MGDPSTPSDLELDLWMKIQAGDFDDAFAMAARLLIISDDAVQRGRVETAIGLMMQRAGLTADSRDQFARALALVGDSGPDRALVLAVGSLSSVLAGALDQAEADANEALVLAAQHDFDFPVRQARTTLAVVNLGRGRLGEALACAEAAASYDDKGIGQAEYRSTAFVVLAMVLAELDRMPQAHVTIAEGIRIAQDEGDTGQEAWYLASQAMLHFIDGSWEAARAETRRSLECAERTGALAARPLAWGIAACIEGLRGNVADARVLVARSRAHRLGPGGGLGEEWVALAVAATTDDADERYDALCEAWFRLRGMPSFLAWKVFAYPLVVLAVQRGDHVLAAAVSQRVGELAEVAGTISARATALCCSAAMTGSPESLDAGLELLRASGRPLPLAFGCVAAARTTVDPVRRSAALHEAAAVFHALGATTWSAVVTRQLVRVAADPPDVPTGPWHLLTPGEQRVVRLAVQGFSNPAIAEQLGVSSRTVQAQLASACRKCDVPGRVLLAGLFAE